MTNTSAADSLPADWEPFSVEALRDLLCGNDDAIQFYLHIARLSNTYDDLIDKDKAVTNERIHDFVWRALFAIPLNPFYITHQSVLRPVLMTGIMNWIAANEMEASGSREECRVAHVIRYAVGDILLAAMVMTGGVEHARKNARRARLMIQDETWAHYAAEQGV